MTPPPPGGSALTFPVPPPSSLLFPALRQDDAPLPTPEAADPPDGPSRQTLLLSGGAFAFIPLSFLVIFYMFMRREFKRSAIRRAQGRGILHSASRGGADVGGNDYGGYGGGGGGYSANNRGRAIPSPTGIGHSGGSGKRHRYGDAAAVAAALDVVPLPDGASTACAICLDESHPDRTEAALACGHTYHGACIKQWLAKSDTCPLCATPVREALFAAAEERQNGKGGVGGAAPSAGIGADVTVAIDDDDMSDEAAWRAPTRPGAARTSGGRLSGNGDVEAPDVADAAEREAPATEAATAAALRPPAMAPDMVVVIRPSGFDHPPVVPPPPVAAAAPSV